MSEQMREHTQHLLTVVLAHCVLIFYNEMQLGYQSRAVDFAVEMKHTQQFLQFLCSQFEHLTTTLRDRFTALLMLSVHVWSCCTCPLCTIDQALVKLVTKAQSYPSRINHSIDPVVINKGNDKHLAPPLMKSTVFLAAAQHWPYIDCLDLSSGNPLLVCK